MDKKHDSNPDTISGNQGRAAMDRITKAVERTHQERLGEGQAANVYQGMALGEGHRRREELKIQHINLSRKILQKHRIITGEQNNEYAEAYKILRTRIWHQMRTNAWHTLAVTSARPDEGKTLTAINLAIGLAMMEIGRTVILVDLDMRRPSIGRYFGLHPEHGVSDYLIGSVSLEQVMVAPDISDRLVLVPGDASLLNSSEILSSPRLPRLLQKLRNSFPSRLVIFDLPPLLATDDALVLAPHLDAFLLVVAEGGSNTEEITQAMHLMQDTPLMGTVLNKSDEMNAHYGYGY